MSKWHMLWMLPTFGILGGLIVLDGMEPNDVANGWFAFTYMITAFVVLVWATINAVRD